MNFINYDEFYVLGMKYEKYFKSRTIAWTIHRPNSRLIREKNDMEVIPF